MTQWMIAGAQVAGNSGSGCECGVSKEAGFGKLIASVCYIGHYAYLPLMMSIAQEHVNQCAYSSRWSLLRFDFVIYHIGICECVRVIWIQIDQRPIRIDTVNIISAAK